MNFPPSQPICVADRKPLTPRMWLVLTLIGGALASPALAVNGCPAPLSCTPSQLIPGQSNVSLTVIGDGSASDLYFQSRGNKQIRASFSGSGITVNSVTVVDDLTLTIDVSVASNAPIEGRTLKISNPDGKNATSPTNILFIIDRPAIIAATINPSTPSTASTLDAIVTSLSNLDGSPVTYTYDWQENGQSTGYTSSVLPPSATQIGRTYRCVITPVKGSIIGSSYTTAAVTIPEDADGNGIQDEWEIANLNSLGSNPDADDDNDGMSNRAEYLFGTDPSNTGSRSPIVAPLNPSSGKFTYSRALFKTAGLSYRVWTSPDLVNWTEQTPATESIAPNGNAEYVEVTLESTLIAANPKLFVRISAE